MTGDHCVVLLYFCGIFGVVELPGNFSVYYAACEGCSPFYLFECTWRISRRINIDVMTRKYGGCYLGMFCVDCLPTLEVLRWISICLIGSYLLTWAYRARQYGVLSAEVA